MTVHGHIVRRRNDQKLNVIKLPFSPCTMQVFINLGEPFCKAPFHRPEAGAAKIPGSTLVETEKRHCNKTAFWVPALFSKL